MTERVRGLAIIWDKDGIPSLTSVDTAGSLVILTSIGLMSLTEGVNFFPEGRELDAHNALLLRLEDALRGTHRREEELDKRMVEVSGTIAKLRRGDAQGS